MGRRPPGRVPWPPPARPLGFPRLSPFPPLSAAQSAAAMAPPGRPRASSSVKTMDGNRAPPPSAVVPDLHLVDLALVVAPGLVPKRAGASLSLGFHHGPLPLLGQERLLRPPARTSAMRCGAPQPASSRSSPTTRRRTVSPLLRRLQICASPTLFTGRRVGIFFGMLQPRIFGVLLRLQNQLMGDGVWSLPPRLPGCRTCPGHPRAVHGRGGHVRVREADADAEGPVHRLRQPCPRPGHPLRPWGRRAGSLGAMPCQPQPCRWSCCPGAEGVEATLSASKRSRCAAPAVWEQARSARWVSAYCSCWV